MLCFAICCPVSFVDKIVSKNICKGIADKNKGCIFASRKLNKEPNVVKVKRKRL